MRVHVAKAARKTKAKGLFDTVKQNDNFGTSPLGWVPERDGHWGNHPSKQLAAYFLTFFFDGFPDALVTSVPSA